MFWNNQRRKNNYFLWGMLFGVIAGGFVAYRMMNQPMKTETSQKKVESKPSVDQSTHTNNQKGMEVEQKDMKQLFDTFLNGTEEELRAKANELN
ncbi:hypothetical protein TEPIDINF_000753 [Tepidibacillus infernus]|uniref:hypothetical protein n=1 Tax=Tepidibacillus infernus TaxID=1806172 RepID=UPI003A2E8981